jgi:uncharacterized membrane protein YgdD (TMEM256/DUF423 family)
LAAAIFGFTGVALGAFGAHALKDLLAESGRTDVWETAVFYQMIHAVALLAVGLPGKLGVLADRTGRFLVASWVGGVLMFSGSLYVLCLSGISRFGAITPVGGLLFLAGWAILFGSFLRASGNDCDG